MSLIQLWPHSSPCRGERYIGMWQAGQRHGPGVVVTQAGVCYQGTFQADKTVVSRVCPGLLLSLHPTPAGGPEAELRLFREGWERGLCSWVLEGARTWAGSQLCHPPPLALASPCSA